MFGDNNLDVSDQSNVLEHDNQDNIYGVVYTPDKDGREYISVNYDSLSENTNTNHRVTISYNKGNTFRRLGLVALIVTLSMAFAVICSFLTAKLVVNYYESLIYNSNDTLDDSDYDHYVYVDNFNSGVITQNKERDELLEIEEAIQAVKDSVVEITTESVQSGFGSYSQYVVSGAGSGVIISTGGYIITNNHVVEGAKNILVRLTNGKEYIAKLIAADSKTDIAVISITPNEGDSFTSAVIGSSDELKLGQTVLAIGNPLGKLGGTVSDGIISCLAREIVMDGSGTIALLQTNAAVSPGNSGGGLFDLYGRLIGIVNAKSTGQGVEGISFAIPIDTAWSVAVQLIDKGYVSGRPAIGATIKQVQYGHNIFGEYYYQLVVTSTNGNSKLKPNDVIYAIDNIEVSSLSEVNEILTSKHVGDKVVLTVRRDRRNIEVEIVLVEHIPAVSNNK